jgi:Flp pilus assembly protein CpaB
VTLAVTPEQSEKLVFTEEMGSVWLALVSTEGIEKEDTAGQTYDNIFE